MKALKIVVAILIPVAVVAAILPVLYPIISPIDGSELDIGAIPEQLMEILKNLPEAINLYGIAIIIMTAAPLVGALLFVLWLVFSIVKKRFIGILFGFLALIALTFCAVGVFVDATFNLLITTLELEANAGYGIMTYVGLGAIVLFVVAFVLHVIIMFKAAKARKAAKKGKEVTSEETLAAFQYDPNDFPPVLFEEHKPDVEPDLVLHKVDHIEVGPNHVLKGHYVRDDEIAALLATKRYSDEEEIPESILRFLESKYEAEERGVDLPIFDPNFEPTREDYDVLTEEEQFVVEALRAYRPRKEEPVNARVLAFLQGKRYEEEVDLPIFDPNFVPSKEEVESPVLSEEELRVVRAMSHLEPKHEEVEYVDLPMFHEHKEEPVEYVEEVIRVEEPEEVVDAPKLASAKPVHVSKNKEGKYQLKQVGENKPFAVFETEAEALRFAEGVKKVNGVAVRVHDEEGRITSL